MNGSIHSLTYAGVSIKNIIIETKRAKFDGFVKYDVNP